MVAPMTPVARRQHIDDRKLPRAVPTTYDLHAEEPPSTTTASFDL
jgi:hypothetical protein